MQATSAKNVVFYIFDGFQLLDYSGIAAVFEMANHDFDSNIYEPLVVSHSGGLVKASNGVALNTTKLDLVPKDIEFAIAVGGNEDAISQLLRSKEHVDGLKEFFGNAKYLCSVCSGAFLLATTGALNNKRATTHWSAIDELARLFPKVKVCDHTLYTMDDRVFTSAGVATGIDLGLEIMARLHGVELSNKIAKRLVVSSHRPCDSSQNTMLLAQQNDQTQQFMDLCRWLKQSIQSDVSVDQMASFMHMSPRNFSRRFKQAYCVPPQKYFKALKVEHAKEMLRRGYSSFQVCQATGYKSELGLNKAFVQIEGTTIFQFKKQLVANFNFGSSLS